MFRDELRQDEHQRTREICETRMRLLFEELPWLSGFFVDRDLGVAEISIYAWPGWSASPALREDLDRFLLDLVEEGPEVAQLLRNRTFARSLQ